MDGSPCAIEIKVEIEDNDYICNQIRPATKDENDKRSSSDAASSSSGSVCSTSETGCNTDDIDSFSATSSTAVSPTSASLNGRLSRNACEKNRRDRFNDLVSELAALIPVISKAGRNYDKTTKLRIAASSLRVHFFLSIPRFMVECSIDWEDFLSNDFNGILLIVTSTGSIVFISHNVEQVFGHTQVEMLGHSIYEYIFPDDHADLRRKLSPDGEDPDDNESCTNYSTGSRTYSSPNSWDAPTSYDDFEDQRRSFYVRMAHKTPVRSKHPQFELVHVFGNLRVQKKFENHCSNKDSDKHKEKINRSKDLLIAMIKPCREYRSTELCLLEACKDEYITQHTMDGKIVYSDHRLSIVSGYLLDEVRGRSAYAFMHDNDLPLVLMAFRQMLRTHSNYGKSCYRLRNVSGGYIYLRTRGYLEFNSNSGECTSFICINTLLNKEEGEREIEEMKEKFSPLIQNKDEPGILAIVENLIPSGANSTSDSPATVDPEKLHHAVQALTTNIDSQPVNGYKEIPDKAELEKANIISKTLSTPASCEIIKEEQSCMVYGSSSSPNSLSRARKKSACSPTNVPTGIPANKNYGKLIILTNQVVSERSVTTVSSSCGTASTVTTSSFRQNRQTVLRTAPSIASSSYLPTSTNRAVKRPRDDDTNVVSSSSIDSKRAVFNGIYIKKELQHMNFDMSTEQATTGDDSVVKQYNVVSENLRRQEIERDCLFTETSEILENIPQNERKYHEIFSEFKKCATVTNNIQDYIFQQKHGVKVSKGVSAT